MLKKLLAVLIAILVLCSCGVQEEPEIPEVPEISEPESQVVPEDAALQEWAENLEPIEILDTKNVYPWAIGEIFEIIMKSEPEENKAKELKSIEVCGGENEFFVSYVYSSEIEETAYLNIRVRMNNEGVYTLVARGGGPIDYGLKKNDITLEDIYKHIPQVSLVNQADAPIWEYKEIKLGSKEQLDRLFYYIDNIEEISNITVSNVIIGEGILSEEEAADFIDYFYLLSPKVKEEDTNPASELDTYIYASNDAGEELWRMSIGGLGMVIEFPDDTLQYRFELDEETKDSIFSFVEGQGNANPPTGKPVIYLYPEKETLVSVNLDFDGKITYTYPALNSGWKVLAKPDGTLTNLADNSTHYYLFWEGTARPEWTYEKGFVVKGSETEKFLRENLAKMGLTPREYNDFITYWVPKMQENPYNLVSFSGNEYSEIAKLTVDPKPDSVIRIHMMWKALDEPIEIEPQVLPTYERKGFTLVEWGGTELF